MTRAAVRSRRLDAPDEAFAALGAPDEVFAALGAFGQLVVVDPTTDSVWVRLGPTDLGDAAGIAKLKSLWTAFAAVRPP